MFERESQRNFKERPSLVMPVANNQENALAAQRVGEASAASIRAIASCGRPSEVFDVRQLRRDAGMADEHLASAGSIDPS